MLDNGGKDHFFINGLALKRASKYAPNRFIGLFPEFIPSKIQTYHRGFVTLNFFCWTSLKTFQAKFGATFVA
jgi:hypothetical protein